MWFTASARDAVRQAAVQYGDWGWRVAPAHYTRLPGRHRRGRRSGQRSEQHGSIDAAPPRCSCGHRGCTAPGRHPIGRDWRRDASTDRTTIELWWWSAQPWNIALVTGELFDVWMVPAPVARCALAVIETAGRPVGPVAHGADGWQFFTEPARPDAATPVPTRPGIGYAGPGDFVLAPPSQASYARLRWWRSPFGPGTPRLPPWEPTVDALLVAAGTGEWLARSE